MTQPNIELAKVRDFSAIINDSFLFLKQNFKPLLRSFFTFCGFFIVAAIITGILQQLKMYSFFNENGVGEVASNGIMSYYNTWGTEAALSVLFMVLSYTAIPVTVLCFITLYKEKGNVAPTNEEMWGYIKYYYLKILGCVILNAVIFVVGFVFCIVPGFWLYPILSLTLPIMIVENTSYGYAFNQSFRLIKDNWWTTFGALFIMGLIVGICAGIVTLPATIWSIFSLATHTSGGTIATIITTILSHIALVLYILPVITLALCYFSLTEVKEGTGLMARINQIGEDKASNNLPSEEY
jgi:hypothetical protein